MCIRDCADFIDACFDDARAFAGIGGGITRWRRIRITTGNLGDVVLVAFDERKLRSDVITRERARVLVIVQCNTKVRRLYRAAVVVDDLLDDRNRARTQFIRDDAIGRAC